MSEKKESSRDLLDYSLWCARLASDCPIDAFAAELRAMSRDLITKAQEEARLEVATA